MLKIGYLEECELKKISKELNFSVLDGSIAISMLDGESGFIILIVSLIHDLLKSNDLLRYKRP